MDKRTKTWFITGASSGFGRALAQAVLARGDRAVLAARRRDALADVAAEAGDRALAVELDVTDAAARARAVEVAMVRFGRIDVLANIAGQGSLGAAEEFAPEQLREQMEINFFAAAELTRAILPVMRAQRSGHILNLTSVGGLAAAPGFAAYCASKFALEGWSEALAGEVAPLGIRVTLVEPGAFRTEFSGAKNMRPAERIDAYRPVIEPVEQYLYGGDGKQPGDPVKAAAAMIDAVESDEPPLRLILGQDALAFYADKRGRTDADIARWREVAEATAYEDAEFLAIGG